MTNPLLDCVAHDRRDATNAALEAVFGAAAARARMQRISGGASGASIYRAEAGNTTCVVRIEGPRSPLWNPHQYACMETAAASAIAPPIRYLDADGGVVVMDWIESRSLSEYPGGSIAIVHDLGALLARLQQTAPFPEFREYRVVLQRLWMMLQGKVAAPGLLDAHADGFARLTEGYPWDASPRVSSHNDPNPRNVLFDGERIWLVDWETAYRNDPWVDAAIVAENFAPTPELEHALLQAWLGAPPDAVALARLRLMRVLTRLYYAGLLLLIAVGRNAGAPIADLSAPTEGEFDYAIATGAITPGSPAMIMTLGKMQLASFLNGASDPAVATALCTVREG